MENSIAFLFVWKNTEEHADQPRRQDASVFQNRGKLYSSMQEFPVFKNAPFLALVFQNVGKLQTVAGISHFEKRRKTCAAIQKKRILKKRKTDRADQQEKRILKNADHLEVRKNNFMNLLEKY